MNVKLVQTVPVQDGHYLVKFSRESGPHLVLVQTESDGSRVILTDICPFKALKDKKTLKCITESTRLHFKDFPDQAFWSESPIACVI